MLCSTDQQLLTFQRKCTSQLQRWSSQSLVIWFRLARINRLVFLVSNNKINVPLRSKLISSIAEETVSTAIFSIWTTQLFKQSSHFLQSVEFSFVLSCSFLLLLKCTNLSTWYNPFCSMNGKVFLTYNIFSYSLSIYKKKGFHPYSQPH